MKLNLEKIKVIENDIKKLTNGESKGVSDGIINIEEYKKANYKILWVLKEPYTDKDDNGGWSLTKVFDEYSTWQDVVDKKDGENTLRKIILTSYSILSDTEWKKGNNVKYFNTLKSIAYINIKKHLGKSSSSHKILRNAYLNEENNRILKQQINLYSPDIIIFGRTFDYFKNDLPEKESWKNFSLKFKKDKDYGNYYVTNNHLYIDTYHPACNMLDSSYCNAILEAKRAWEKLKV